MQKRQYKLQYIDPSKKYTVMALTDPAIKNAKPDPSKPSGYRLKPAENGMYVWIHNNGSKYFRLDYRLNGSRNTLALGIYPETTLKEAREKRDIAKKQISEGICPNFERKMKKLGATENSFQAIALDWFDKNMTEMSDKHQTRINAILKNELFPWLGSKPIAELKAPELLATLRRIENRNANETARRALQISGQVFRYAIATGRAEFDITQALQGALKKVKGGNLASMSEPAKVRDLLKSLDGYTGTYIVKSALQLAPLVFVRPGELRQAEWDHINFETKEWRYLVTKTNTPHIVPLSNQAIKILTDLQPLTGRGRYVFPSGRTPNGSRAMSDNALLSALRRMGIPKEEMSIHGFRSMARTMLAQERGLKFRPDILEQQLAHVRNDPNGMAYDRTAFLEERHEIMQAWADYLDNLKADVVTTPP